MKKTNQVTLLTIRFCISKILLRYDEQLFEHIIKCRDGFWQMSLAETFQSIERLAA